MAMLDQNFYKPDALPVTQSTASNQSKVASIYNTLNNITLLNASRGNKPVKISKSLLSFMQIK